MLATQSSTRWFTWLGRRPPGKLFFQCDKVGEPITPLETQLRIKLMMHERSQLSRWQGRIHEGYRLISIYSCLFRNIIETEWDAHLINQVKETEISRYLYSNFTKNRPICPDINIGNVTITPKTEVRDLGVLIDKHLSQINNVCKSAFYAWALNNIRKIRKYLDSHSTERLIHVFISSRIDNCNSLYSGLPVAEIEKLQRVQNAAARLLTGSKRTEHITPTLRNLHWLPDWTKNKV